MSHVFIAHVEEDAHVALEITLGLEEEGYSTWCYELDTVPGPLYLNQVVQAINECQAIVLLISPRSLVSNQVTNEVVRAYEDNKHFIPILLDITDTDFKNRQPVWRQCIGAATSIVVPKEGASSISTRLRDGLKALAIQPKSKTDTGRISKIRQMLEELKSKSVHENKEYISTVKSTGTLKVKRRSRTPILAALSSLVIIAVILIIIFMAGSGNQEGIAPNPTTMPTDLPSPTLTAISTTSASPLLIQTPTPSPIRTSTITSPAQTGVALPDLFIQDLTWSPKSFSVGDTINITSIVTNKGTSKSGQYYIYLYLDNSYKDSKQTSLLSAGATSTFQFALYDIAPGTHTVSAIVDYTNLLSESDETNNSKEITLPEPLLADLIVQDITWSPANPLAGQDVTFTTSVKNQGSGNAVSFSVMIHHDGAQWGTDVYDKVPSEMTIGETSYWYRIPSGTHTFRAYADFYNKVVESNETNNMKEVTIMIP